MQKQKIQKPEISSFFPCQPYEIQTQLATSIYQTISERKNKVLMVESPTGTGKTYSLLVGTLKWLSDHSKQVQTQNQKQQSSISMPSWIPKASTCKGEVLYENKMKKISQIKSIKEIQKAHKQPNKTGGKKKINFEDEQFEVQSDDENISKKTKGRGMFPQLEIHEQDACLPKIIFTSRTHSQLSQVIQSFKKLNFNLKCVSLASKQHLCVNKQLGKNNIHEKCQYLLSHTGCHYFHKNELEDFFNSTIEESKEMGEKNSLCSYYGVKNISGIADLLCIPYASILNAQIRKKLNINIDNSIIIFDEAHNLLEQDANLQSTELTYNQLLQLCKRVDEYKGKYQNRMKKNNLFTINHIQQICRALMNALSKIHAQKKKEQYLKMTKLQFFMKLQIPEIQLFKIKRYIQLTNFDQKLTYFSKEPFSSGIIHRFIDFLSSLISTQNHLDLEKLQQNIILIKSLSLTLAEVSMKIFCLEGTSLINISEKARMVILAGGTMQPISSFTSLFSQYNVNWSFLKYGHIIGQNQCKIYCISSIKNRSLKYNFEEWKNNSQSLMNSSIQILKIVLKRNEQSSGMAIFIQNYQVLEEFKKHLGAELSGIPIFFDSQTNEDSIFEKYRKKIEEEKKSAIIVSVMGGRLSQGINFCDKLVRSLVVFGLPYPSIKAPEIQEKMVYLDEKNKLLKKKQQVFGYFGAPFPKQTEPVYETGKQYYQNCCLKVINQTIGRAIRHKKDYANIYLVDCRFSDKLSKLSSWLQNRVQPMNNLE